MEKGTVLKRVVSALTRMLWSVMRVGLAWIPPVIVLVAGAFYIFNILVVLSAPGTGLKFSYIGRAGDHITIETGTYALDPFSLRINATDIEIRNGTMPIATADRAWVGKTFDSITADLGNVDFRMIRREDGSFDAFDLLLPDDESKPPMPIHIRADSLDLTYLDRTVKEPVSEQILITKLEVSSSGPDTVTSGSVAWKDALVGDVVARIAPDSKFALTFKSARGDLVQMRPLLRRYLPEDLIAQVDEWEAREVNVTGDFSMDGNDKGIEHLSGTFAWEAQGLRHRDFFANAVSFGRANLYNKIANVEAQVREPGRFASFEGALDWHDELSGQGRVRANLASTERAWPIARRFVPSEVRGQDIGFTGGVSFEAERFSVAGNLGIASARAGTETVRDIAAHLVADTTRVSVEVAHAEWRTAPLRGWVSADYQQSDLRGSIYTKPDQLVRVEFPTEAGDISVAAEARAIIQGSPQDPEILASLDGLAQIQRPHRMVLLGDVDARVQYANGLAHIDRAVVSGPTGVVTLSGEVDIAEESVNVDIELGGLDLAALDEGLQGVAYAKAKAVGPLSDPQVIGDLAVLDVTVAGYTIPKLTATARLQNQTILLSQIDLTAGLGEIGGTAGYDLRTQEIAGLLSARDISFSDFVPEAGVIGRLNADQIVLGGTASDPTAQFSGWVSDMLVAGIPVDQVRYQGRADQTQVVIDSLTATVEEGSVEANGVYRLDDSSGSARITAQNLPLSRIPLDAELLHLSGMAGLEATFSLQSNGDWLGQGTVRITNATANNFPIGSGAFLLEANSEYAEIQGGVSSLEGLLEIPQLRYGFDDESLNGELLATNMGLRELIRAASRQIRLDDLQTERILRDLDGLVTAELGFAGTREDPILEVRMLDASDLTSLGHTLGRLQLEGLATSNLIKVDRLQWIAQRLTSPDSTEPSDSIVALAGAWTRGEDGASDRIDATGRLVRFDPTVMQLFLEDAPEVHASIDADFAVNGPIDQLAGQASLTAQDIQYRNDAGELFTIPVTLQTETIDYVDNVLRTQAKLSYRGLEGDLSAVVPLSAFRSVPEGSVSIDLALRDRPLQDLREYAVGLDVDRSRGLISGQIGLAGQRGNFQLNGSASLRGTESEPARLAFTDFETVLENVTAQLNSTDTGIQILARAESSRGGTALAEGSIDLEEFLRGDFSEARLNQIDLNVRLALEQFALRETIALANPHARPGEPARIAADRPSTGILNGQVTLTGTAARPLIGGEVRGDRMDASIPMEFPETAEGRPGAVEPVLQNLRFVIAPGSKLHIPTGSLEIGGVASLNGPLSSIEIRAPFTVESGVLNLPASRVSLDQGTVNVTSGIGSSDPRADVDLTGSTIVTLRRTSSQYQTYRINLHIRGNLLDPEGVLIEGSSDPPDLSQEEIRAIIGQREFVESILSTAFGEGSRDGLRDSLYTLAVPTLTQGITSELAEQLQLDYLVLDYNPFDGPVLRAGREISRGLMVEVSRQLYRQAQQRDTNNSEPLKFELQLSYRPPVRDPFLSRFRITAGLNERVPWRVGVEYSSRF